MGAAGLITCELQRTGSLVSFSDASLGIGLHMFFMAVTFSFGWAADYTQTMGLWGGASSPRIPPLGPPLSGSPEAPMLLSSKQLDGNMSHSAWGGSLGPVGPKPNFHVMFNAICFECSLMLMFIWLLKISHSLDGLHLQHAEYCIHPLGWRG